MLTDMLCRGIVPPVLVLHIRFDEACCKWISLRTAVEAGPWVKPPCVTA